MFINFTNHPCTNWSAKQIAEAKTYGEIIDMPFPQVDPHGDEDYILKLALDCVDKIIKFKPEAVLCQGEMTLAFAVTTLLTTEYGITVLAACSERTAEIEVGLDGESIKSAVFRFVRFRKYKPS